jgi:hypothetical protein
VWRWLAGFGVVVALAATVSYAPALDGRVESLAGGAAPGAYVTYSYRGSRFNFVDSLSYARPGGVVRTDAAGAFSIPGFLHVHRPLDGRLEPWIDWVYAPELHHAFGPVGPLTESVSGLIEVDWARGLIRLADLTADPERWSRTIELLEREGRMEDARAEYRTLLARHAGTPRAMPDAPHLRYLPEVEREARLAEMRQEIEREPLWGAYLEQRWGERLGR